MTSRAAQFPSRATCGPWAAGWKALMYTHALFVLRTVNLPVHYDSLSCWHSARACSGCRWERGELAGGELALHVFLLTWLLPTWRWCFYVAHIQGRILGGFGGPGPPGVTKGAPKRKKKGKGKERERGEKREKKRKKEEKKGVKEEKRKKEGAIKKKEIK